MSDIYYWPVGMTPEIQDLYCTGCKYMWHKICHDNKSDSATSLPYPTCHTDKVYVMLWRRL